MTQSIHTINKTIINNFHFNKAQNGIKTMQDERVNQSWASLEDEPSKATLGPKAISYHSLEVLAFRKQDAPTRKHLKMEHTPRGKVMMACG